MTYADSPKAKLSLMLQNLTESLDRVPKPKVGDLCPTCGRPYENLARMDQEPFICCAPCEQEQQRLDSERED